MLPPLFYLPPSKEAAHVAVGDVIDLPKDEAHHATKVMRLEAGALVMLVDGQGMSYRAELAQVSTKSVTARVHSVVREYGEPRVHVTLAAGLSAGSKFDEVVQRATELGVKRLVPLVTEKSKVKLDDPSRAKSRVNRLSKVAVAAMKQCRRSFAPEVSFPLDTKTFLNSFEKTDVGLVFHPTKSALPLSQVLTEPSVRRVTLLVGPESGFSDNEVEAALAAGFKAVSLGDRILRTETAGPVVTALVMHRLGELG